MNSRTCSPSRRTCLVFSALFEGGGFLDRVDFLARLDARDENYDPDRADGRSKGAVETIAIRHETAASRDRRRASCSRLLIFFRAPEKPALFVMGGVRRSSLFVGVARDGLSPLLASADMHRK
jgi:hypothetical protein